MARDAYLIWDVRQPAVRLALWGLFWIGWAMVFASTCMINHFDLFGLRQAYLAWRGKPYADLEFRKNCCCTGWCGTRLCSGS